MMIKEAGDGRNGLNELVHTPRIRNSMNLFEAERPRKVDIAADQEDVSSVVVLNSTYIKFSPLITHIFYTLLSASQGLLFIGWGLGEKRYSLAKTPLKAAQAPLAAARANQEGGLKLILLLTRGGGG